MKVSVIIPVYNAQNYLKKCLDSVLNQTLKDIEVICIDDCSSDGSYNILKDYSSKDSRLKYYRNDKNIGQGLTRNRGLDLVQGEFVAFVDCDDWIEPEMYEVLYSKNDIQKFDLVCCNLVSNFPNGFSGIPQMPSRDLITKDFLINEALSPSIEFFSPNSPCDKIYRKETIDKFNLRFESERKFLYEDKLFNLMFLSSNPSFYFEPKVFYHYMIRYGSTMTSYKENLVEKYFYMEERIVEVLNKNGCLHDEQRIRLKRSLFEMTFVFSLNALVYNKSIGGKLSSFRELINDKRVSSNAKLFKIGDIPKSNSRIKGLVKAMCFLILKYCR
ncbi:glycosyltransferase family 2 protein [Flavobacterium sharifuzzamanii]|uniref:glycosyltransferase family 2 protein n=1 Tax=Flavobacterium sharifuzzamanii TaxID=2211133 RepID=UPI000DAD2C24|nr:glycosyltransferase family 2 protein [Flavobacterium sharifuzzamanii]KAF2081154.1 glycosyltransferase family 2 protein [Flavobacterium sharifuzzamanii]